MGVLSALLLSYYPVQISCLLNRIILLLSKLIGTSFIFYFSLYSGVDFSSPWHVAFVKARKDIAANLWITHPAMQVVLQMCQKSLQELLMVDLSELR